MRKYYNDFYQKPNSKLYELGYERGRRDALRKLNEAFMSGQELMYRGDIIDEISIIEYSYPNDDEISVCVEVHDEKDREQWSLHKEFKSRDRNKAYREINKIEKLDRPFMSPLGCTEEYFRDVLDTLFKMGYSDDI